MAPLKEITREDQYLLKEMGLLQDCFNKYDDWITRVRTGLVVGLSALASLPVWQHGHFSICKLIAAAALLVLASYIAEGVTRNQNWFWYVKRKEEIEDYLNTKPADNGDGKSSENFHLYAVKYQDKCKVKWYEQTGRCWLKRDTLLFHFFTFALFSAVIALLT